MDNRPKYVQELHSEWLELNIKLVNIYYFIECSKKYTELSEEKQKLLISQKSAMTNYVEVLTQRLKIEERSIKNEGAKN